VAGATLALAWKGDAVKAKVRAAAILGVNQTMAQAVTHAKRNHPWHNRSTTLEGGISILFNAAPQDAGVRGSWGVFDVAYALAQEVGAIIRPVTKKALRFKLPDGSYVVAKQVVLPARPYLRPAADVCYPRLGHNIKTAFAGGDRG
jgi:hypothetical protein